MTEQTANADQTKQTCPEGLIDEELISAEWPREKRDGLYFNNGSCSVKPQSVVQALHDGWERLNRNPTLLTFFDNDPRENARNAAAKLLNVSSESLLLIQNSTYGLQLVMQSFLLSPGDEFLTTNHEHGCINALCRYLEEHRGIVVKRADMDPLKGSDAFTASVLGLVSGRTKLVEFSEIDCYTGWRPDISNLISELKREAIPVLVDGAHVPGQGLCTPAEYPMWVASGHKWLGGPNSTGFLYAAPEFAERLTPLCIGDRYYNEATTAAIQSAGAPVTASASGAATPAKHTHLSRLEWQGTADPVRWLGLYAAIELQERLGQAQIGARQLQLVSYLRRELASLPVTCIFRTQNNVSEACAMISLFWEEKDLLVDDLPLALWERHRIWVQPDSFSSTPGRGMRLSCPIYIDTGDIDKLVTALRSMLRQ